MKATQTTIHKQKRTYVKPRLEQIKLDKEISMVMMSTPPGDPWSSVQPEHFSVDPFKTNNA